MKKYLLVAALVAGCLGMATVSEAGVLKSAGKAVAKCGVLKAAGKGAYAAGKAAAKGAVAVVKVVY